jgi:hypothetical protein
VQAADAELGGLALPYSHHPHPLPLFRIRLFRKTMIPDHPTTARNQLDILLPVPPVGDLNNSLEMFAVYDTILQSCAQYRAQ